MGPPNALDVESSVLATFVFLTLESAKLGVVEDVVVGGGGMSASKVDLPPAFVGLISKQGYIHGEVVTREGGFEMRGRR